MRQRRRLYKVFDVKLWDTARAYLGAHPQRKDGSFGSAHRWIGTHWERAPEGQEPKTETKEG